MCVFGAIKRWFVHAAPGGAGQCVSPMPVESERTSEPGWGLWLGRSVFAQGCAGAELLCLPTRVFPFVRFSPS